MLMVLYWTKTGGIRTAERRQVNLFEVFGRSDISGLLGMN